MSAATSTVEAPSITPVVGMQYLHARRVNWDKTPLLMQVTSIKGETVFTRPVRYGYVDKGSNAIKVTKVVFPQVVKEVTFVPEAKVTQSSVKLTTRQAEQLFQKAHIAGRRAGDTVGVAPMVVEQHAHPLDDSSPVVRRDVVMDGVCGFAWVKVTPGNSSFARWLKATGRARTGYYGGVEMSVSEYNQSLTRKEAYAHAFAQVLTEAGVQAYGQSRLD